MQYLPTSSLPPFKILGGIQIQVFLSSFFFSCHKQCVFPGVKKIGYINVAACLELRNLGKILYEVICKWENWMKPVSQS
jgi:hypothetical protein